MTDETYVKYSKTLTFRNVDAQRDAALLIEFGRDLYRCSLGNEKAFFRDFGPRGAKFPRSIAQAVDENASFAQLLVENAVEIGLVVLSLDEHQRSIGRIHHLYVRADHRGQGFGGVLEDYARDTLRDAGARRAQLNVAVGNHRAINYYQSQGWQETARRGGLIFLETDL